MPPVRTVEDLSDDELEECFDGSSNVDMVREIFEKAGVINEIGYVDIESFGQWFAYALEGYIDADEDTEEWDEAYANNQEWGEGIAENINSALDTEGDE